MSRDIGYKNVIGDAIEADSLFGEYQKKHVALMRFGQSGLSNEWANATDFLRKTERYHQELGHFALEVSLQDYPDRDKLLFDPFYDGNGQAEALVVPIEKEFETIFKREKVHTADTYFERCKYYYKLNYQEIDRTRWLDMLMKVGALRDDTPDFDTLAKSDLFDAWREANQLIAKSEKWKTHKFRKYKSLMPDFAVPFALAAHFHDKGTKLGADLHGLIEIIVQDAGPELSGYDLLRVKMMLLQVIIDDLKCRELYESLTTTDPVALTVSNQALDNAVLLTGMTMKQELNAA